MKSLASPSSRVVVVVNRENVFVHRAEACFLRPKKNANFRFLNLVCFLPQRKPMKPVICFSSKTQTEMEIADAQIQETYNIKTIHVKFQLQKECSFGQEFLLVGDDPMFGLWDPSSAIPMNWSDGNLWTVELDIPVGKSIQFKFLLKESTGNILWQPGPDRIFQTWETKNMITVCEDWADAELQKILEEDGLSNQIEGSNVNSDMFTVTENMTYQIEESTFNITKEPTIAASSTDPAEKPVAVPWKEQIVADNISPSQEKTRTIVSENITPKWPTSFSEPCEEQVTARSSMLTEKRVTFPCEDSSTISKKKLMVADNIFGNNCRATTVRNLASTHIEGSLINYEEGPVLVPGLTPLAVKTEEANEEEAEKQMSFDGSVEAFESKELNMPELDMKQEQYTDQAEATPMINGNKQKYDDELKQTSHPADKVETMINGNEDNSVNERTQPPHPAQSGDQSDSEPIKEVLHSDMEWGRKLLQNFLSNFTLV